MWFDWWPSIWKEMGQTLIGSLWITIGLGFTLFFYQYFTYYHRAFRLGQKEYAYAYQELDEHARRIAISFIMYLIATYVLAVVVNTNDFIDCAVRGAIFCAVFLPVINSHFS